MRRANFTLMKRSLSLSLLALAVVLSLTYLGFDTQRTVSAGLSYPTLGVAHLVATISVSVWAIRLGGDAALVVPAAFLGSVGMGMVLGTEEVPLLLFVEAIIWASGLVLAYGAIAAVRLPVTETAGLVVLFGLYHGYALGGEFVTGGALPID